MSHSPTSPHRLLKWCLVCHSVPDSVEGSRVEGLKRKTKTQLTRPVGGYDICGVSRPFVTSTNKSFLDEGTTHSDVQRKIRELVRQGRQLTILLSVLLLTLYRMNVPEPGV